MHGNKRHTDVKNRLLDYVGKGEGGIIWENSIETCIFSSVQSLSRVRLFATPWITARQASLSITNSRSSPKLASIESVMPSRHLILCRPLLLLPPIPPSINVFSNESTLRMRWPKYWSFSFSIIPSKEIPGLISIDQNGHHQNVSGWGGKKEGVSRCWWGHIYLWPIDVDVW